MNGVAILGSTGSVGENTLDVIARHPDRFRVVALGANRNVAKLASAMREANKKNKLVRLLPSERRVQRWVDQARKLDLKITY